MNQFQDKEQNSRENYDKFLLASFRYQDVEDATKTRVKKKDLSEGFRRKLKLKLWQNC